MLVIIRIRFRLGNSYLFLIFTHFIYHNNLKIINEEKYITTTQVIQLNLKASRHQYLTQSESACECTITLSYIAWFYKDIKVLACIFRLFKVVDQNWCQGSNNLYLGVLSISQLSKPSPVNNYGRLGFMSVKNDIACLKSSSHWWDNNYVDIDAAHLLFCRVRLFDSFFCEIGIEIFRVEPVDIPLFGELEMLGFDIWRRSPRLIGWSVYVHVWWNKSWGLSISN